MKKPIIGIVGGGQLGKMLIEEAIRYNVDCITLDPDTNSPASNIASKHLVGSIKDANKIQELAQHADVLTYEIEHINIESLLQLETQGKTLIPSPKILQIVQDKGLQKNFYANHHIPTAPFVIVQNKTEWKTAIEKKGFTKFVAKLCKEGYDGKGVVLLTAHEIINNLIPIPFDEPTVLEDYIENDKEISIIVNRNRHGEINTFPAVEMQFDPIANLVTYLKSPASISEAIAEKAKYIAQDIIIKMNGVGIFAIEMFVTPDGNIIVNEMAPRPHNSGHQTIEANYTSQYEQLLRILLDLPLGNTDIIQPSAMLNILGASNFSGNYFLDGEAEILKIPGVYIHLYNKKESKPMRKLGHITILAPSQEEVISKVNTILKTIKIKPLD